MIYWNIFWKAMYFVLIYSLPVGPKKLDANTRNTTMQRKRIDPGSRSHSKQSMLNSVFEYTRKWGISNVQSKLTSSTNVVDELFSSGWNNIPFILNWSDHRLGQDTDWSLIPCWMKTKWLICHNCWPNCVFFNFPILQNTAAFWRRLVSINVSYNTNKKHIRGTMKLYSIF